MEKYSEEFADCVIEVGENGSLTINNKRVEHSHDTDTDTWSSHLLPYTTYPSMKELARALARDTSEFVSTNQ